MVLVTQYICNIPTAFCVLCFKKDKISTILLFFFFSLSLLSPIMPAAALLHCSFLVSSLFNRPIFEPGLSPGQVGAKAGNILLYSVDLTEEQCIISFLSTTVGER